MLSYLLLQQNQVPGGRTNYEPFTTELTTVIDDLLADLDARFSDEMITVFRAMKCLSPHDDFGCYCEEDLLTLVQVDHFKGDFTDYERQYIQTEMRQVIFQLRIDFDLEHRSKMKIQDVMIWLTIWHRNVFEVVTRLCILVCVLPVSSASAERNFSGLKLMKTRLRSNMGDDWLDDCLTLYMEKDLLQYSLDNDNEMERVVNIFRDLKPSRRGNM